jgi:hypothetical protein
MNLKLVCACSLVLCCLAIIPIPIPWAEAEIHVGEGTVSGRIFDATSKTGIPDLTVKLIPPRTSNKAEKVTTTGQSGEFRFDVPSPGKYLLEVYQGLTLLFRDVVDTTHPSDKVIELKRKE